MWAIVFLNFIFTCCIAVFFYTQQKDKEDYINELYDMYYKLYEIKENKENNNKTKSKSKVINFDKCIF